ncbi:MULTISPECIES: insulinase family protein [Staphylococcus]|uniref:HycF n=6 Tax=Staphylococcus TaxID=1279 RepID=A0A221C8S9_STAHY|nr:MULTISPECIES: insulinase family protein [Staphylococcus]ASL69768.1 HycF [Staphylococcus hyicus]MBY7664374.1 insulinase family protein [Staphylococcus agnetis]MCO4325724.1 insulinase family protein [Staphylococcus agnetis]MCO4356559.1 insulinase family protein [Staphylococcus agnetis]MCO4362762.1 insulinase family protein [Staphylococcus agnetis]
MLDELDNNIMKIQFGELSGIGFHIKNSYINCISVKINFGGIDSKIGYAHFLEHMKFWIGENNLYEEMKNISIVLNATTSGKSTYFTFFCVPCMTEDALNILLKYLNNHDYLKKIFENEKKVVINEIKGYKSIQSQDVKLNIIRDRILGNEKDINQISLYNLHEISKKYYDRDNMSVYVVGDIKFNKDTNFSNYQNVVTKKKIITQDGECEIQGTEEVLFLKIIFLNISNEKKLIYYNGGFLYYGQKQQLVKNITLFEKNDTLANNIYKDILDKMSAVVRIKNIVEFWNLHNNFFSNIQNICESEKLMDLINELKGELS